MTMLDVLKRNLEDGMRLENIKELHSMYKFDFVYNDHRTKGEIYKTCTPKMENRYTKSCIASFMSSIMFDLHDYKMAREWLDKVNG